MDFWIIAAYVGGIVLNIVAVAAWRKKVATWGQEFLASGRGAVVAVFVICLVELLVVGRFAALEDPAAFVELLQQAWILAGATVGTHVAATGTGVIRK